jgi:hypothetical protein
MITKRELLQYVEEGKHKRVATGGWCDVEFSSLHKQAACNLDYVENVQSTYTLRFSTSITSSPNDSADYLDQQMYHAAQAFHNEIFGDITNQLRLVLFRAQYGDKQECITLIKNLLTQLDE